MSHQIHHLRVGQAWTAYIAPVAVALVVGLVGVAALVSGVVASSAADALDPAAAMAPFIPTPAVDDKKSSHREAHSWKRESVAPTPAVVTVADRENVKTASGHLALLGAGMIALAALYLTYRVLYIRSCQLFTDDNGVWLHRGVLPWAKGSRGVKWRDLEGATMFTGLKSWLLRSHTVRVSHRFTKDSEIVVAHVPRGAQVVGQINEIHRRLLMDTPSYLGIDAAR
jgi:hypothetical protein